MKHIALTGSIGSGKSTVLKMFEAIGVPCWDADAAVHKLYKAGGLAYVKIGRKFGEEYLKTDEVDRQKLGKLVLSNPNEMQKLEDIVHPLVSNDRAYFLHEASKSNPPYAIIDIPLLYETNAESEFDEVIVVACDYDTQKSRVLARPNMTEAKFKAIVQKQIPTSEKVKLADYVIDTSTTIEETLEEVKRIDNIIRNKS